MKEGGGEGDSSTNIACAAARGGGGGSNSRHRSTCVFVRVCVCVRARARARACLRACAFAHGSDGVFPPPPTPLIRRSAPPVYSRRAHQTVRACLRACEKERGLLAPRTADSTPPRAALANPPALRRAERTRTRLPPGGAIGSLRFTVPPPPPTRGRATPWHSTTWRWRTWTASAPPRTRAWRWSGTAAPPPPGSRRAWGRATPTASVPRMGDRRRQTVNIARAPGPSRSAQRAASPAGREPHRPTGRPAGRSVRRKRCIPNGSGKRVQAEADSSGRGGGKGEGGKVVRVWWFAIARRRRAPRADVGGTPPGPGRDGVCERVVGGRERRGPPGASCTAAPPTPVRSPVRAPPPLPRLRPPPARPPRRRNEPAEIHPPHPAPAVLPPPPPVSARPPADGPTPAPRTLAPRTRPYRGSLTQRRKPSRFIIWSPCSYLRPERETKSEQTKMQDEYGLWIPLMSSRKDETAVWY